MVILGLCLYIPSLMLLWATVVFGVRWTRTGRRPPRFLRRILQGDQRVLLPSLLAGLMTWNFAVSPTQPWHHNAFSHWLWLSPWTWWGCCVAAVALPIAVSCHLTKPNPAP